MLRCARVDGGPFVSDRYVCLVAPVSFDFDVNPSHHGTIYKERVLNVSCDGIESGHHPYARMRSVVNLENGSFLIGRRIWINEVRFPIGRPLLLRPRAE